MPSQFCASLRPAFLNVGKISKKSKHELQFLHLIKVLFKDYVGKEPQIKAGRWSIISKRKEYCLRQVQETLQTVEKHCL